MKMFYAGKTRMNGLPNRQDRFAISISHVSMLTRDKNSSYELLCLKVNGH